MVVLAIRYWYLIAIAALSAALLFTGLQWQNAREEVGAQKVIAEAERRSKEAFREQLAKANDKVLQTADDAKVSYGHCQDLAKTNVTQAFDQGTLFGRSTCTVPTKLP